VSGVVSILWRSLEYSNQNLSHVTNFCAGLTTGVDCCQCILCNSYASLCTFQPRLPPEFSCLWHPTNCGHLTMDTTSSDKHSA
jgi:hypothetical protein